MTTRPVSVPTLASTVPPAPATPWSPLLRFVAVLLLAVSAGATLAQPVDPDPPGRVGKISLLSGTVTQTDIRTGEQETATLNWPLTSGQRLSTGRLGRAEVRIGSFALRMDGDTDVDFARIDDELIQVAVLRGTASVRVRNRELLREIDLLTPGARIVLDDVGRYRIDVDQPPGTTAITAFVGHARVAAGNMLFTVQSGQRGELRAPPSTGFILVAPSSDVFDDWVLQRERRDDVIASSQYVSRETTGIETLDEHGTWRYVPEYGTVWFPAYVPTGWAPYRHGHWAWVAPWGWTWIDDAPWGFTPFHYGRWALAGGVWCWVPGAYLARPVFAPALVAWYGAPGVGISIGIGNAVGWFPLAPGEVYIPPYRYTRRYITGINVQHVTNINHITVINPPPRYVHQTPRTATWAPDDAVARARPIQRVVRTPPPEDQARLPAAITPPPSLHAKRPAVRTDDRVRPAPRGTLPAAEAPGSARPPKLEGRGPAVVTPVPPAGRGMPERDDDDARRTPRTGNRLQPPAAVAPPPAQAAPSRSGEGDRGDGAPRQPKRSFAPQDEPREAPRVAPAPRPTAPPAAAPAPFERPQPRVHDVPRVPQAAPAAPMPKIERPDSVPAQRSAPPPARAPQGGGPARDEQRNDIRKEPRGEAQPRTRQMQRDN